MYLYRPFLHYLTGAPSRCYGSQEHFQKYALSCIEASRNIINMAKDMNRNRLLFGAEWRIAHMILTAALSLLYVPLSNRSSVLASSVLADLETAKMLLSDLRPYCIRAQRGYLVLTVVPLLILPIRLANFLFQVLTAAFSKPCEPLPSEHHNVRYASGPLLEGLDPAYTVALRERIFETCPSSRLATNATALNALDGPTSLPHDQNPFEATRMIYHHVTEPSQRQPGELVFPPTRITPQAETTTPLQAPALAILGLSPEFTFNESTFYGEARPSSILQDIAFNDDPFYQLFGIGDAGLDDTAHCFAGLGGGF
jgi:hypothetical protein